MRKWFKITVVFLFVAFLGMSIWHQYSLNQKYPNQPELSKLQRQLLAEKIESKKKPKPDKPDRAMLEMVQDRSSIDGRYSYSGNWRFEAYQKAKRMTVVPEFSRALTWTERGPGNIAGRCRSIVVDPTNSNRWWIGSVGGGIWKTEDSGASWVSVTDDLPILSVTTIDICRNTPSVLYAGTGEGFYNGDAISGDGLFKSTDGGNNWTQVAVTAGDPAFRYVNRLVVDPDDANTVVVVTNTGTYKTTDGGVSFTNVLAPGSRVQQIIANPLNFNTQFLTVNGDGIYKSKDAGSTWLKVSDEMTTVPGRVEIGIAAVDTNVLYASVVNDQSGLAGFWRAADAGDTWVLLTDSQNTNWLGGQGWYDNTLVVSPNDANVVFVGGIDLYRVNVTPANSTIAVTKLTHWYSGAGYPYVHADQHFLVTIPSGQNSFSIIAANDGGIHFSADEGVNWTDKNNNINVTQYYDVDRHPNQEQYVGGSQDNGTHVSPVNPTYSSVWPQRIGGDGFDCAWNKSDGNIVYGTLYNTRIYKSTDGGANFTAISSGSMQSNVFTTPLEMDPSNSDKLFTLGDGGTVWYTTDGGTSWNSTAGNIYNASRGKIRVSKANSDVVWVGNTSRDIAVSTDGGSTFSPVTGDVPDTYKWLVGLETHPFDGNIAYLTFGYSGEGKIYKTEDMGQSWTDITGNLPDVPVYCVLVMPYDTNIIWAGTDLGIFVTQDGGTTWAYLNENIPAVAVHRLKIVGDEVIAATHGRGVWTVTIPELNNVVYPPVSSSLGLANPNTNEIQIRFVPRAVYDSVQVWVNAQKLTVLTGLTPNETASVTYVASPPETVETQVIAWSGGVGLPASPQSTVVNASVAFVDENFDSGTTNFEHNFNVGSVSGFSSPVLNTNHNYEDGKSYTAMYPNPVEITATSIIRYKDVAIVEPGDAGVEYPQTQMWDYVTVEGSQDGVNWDILIQPYDCRSNSSWQTAWDNTSAGDESMFVEHTIDLTSTYTAGTKIYVRFRLFADGFVNGWGWAIDDVVINERALSADDEIQNVKEFKLFGNYPNPFNPSTIIRYNVPQTGNVSVKVFNVMGQLVETLVNEVQKPGVKEVRWNATNRPSGAYFYRVQFEKQSQSKKMILTK